MNFTEKQIENWKVYEKVRESGKYKMFSEEAMKATGLNEKDYWFVMNHYIGLKEAAESEGRG
ncbi:MAG: hypothetical protein PHD04_03960 [Candidatus Pacebacteria bacterium]|nr:hypothetical protein [Candidatus Paceibacterota bacterium]